MQAGLISICIPSYKRVHYLRRLLDSIAAQTYKSFEVIVTDDSGEDKSVADLLENYKAIFTVVYQRNKTALGTPKNWMAGISLASGEWIKLIHDDDWLYDARSLETFALEAARDKDLRLIFGGYTAFYEASGKKEERTITAADFHRILRNPYILFAGNKLGPPSTLMIHNSIREYYDPEMKWFVDIEYYVRMLQKVPASYIASPLIYMSYNDSQVTNDCFHNPSVEIPEAIHIINTHGPKALRGLLVYDAWWRTLRNGDVLSPQKLQAYANDKNVPVAFLKMAAHISKVPKGLLKTGAFSKLAMSVSYILNRARTSQ